ncbi:MAG: hypothetical protein ACKVOQ_14545 [Cyclobacteriaceae bacterium]
MKKIKISIVLVLALAACSADDVQKDLLNYVNTEMPKLATLESEAVDAYGSVSGDNYKDDSTMYATIKETVIPKYEEFSAKLAAIHPATKEVTTMNDEYLKAAADQLEGFKLICLAIEKQDPNIIEQANADIEEAKNLLDVWRTDLNEQCKKHGVVLDGAK